MDKYNRNQKDTILESDLIFQAISWFGKDIEIESDDNEDNCDSENEKEYQIYVHGVNQNGESVCLRIMNFVYYYYVKIPDRYQGVWGSEQTNILYKYLKFRLGKAGVGLVNKTLVNKVDIMGFRNLEKQKFIRLCFKTELAAKRCKYLFAKHLKITELSQSGIKFVLYESNLDMIVKFTHLRDIRTAGWIKVKKNDFSLENDNISSAQIQATVYWKQVHPYLVDNVDYSDIAPFRILSWDIETYSSRGFPEFPNADIKNDFISQIGCCLWIFGKEKIKFILTCVNSNDLDDGILINCKNEKTMIKTFCDLMSSLDPDILTGYNIWGFDDKYMWRRIEINGLVEYASKMSRIIGIEPELEDKNLSSGAYGHNEFKIINCPGRETLDLIMAVRREYKLESYKLGKVGEHFKQGTKVSMIEAIGVDGMLSLDYTKADLDNNDNPDSEKVISEYDVMFRIIKNKDPDQVKIVCDYCIQDANLVIDLMENLCIIPNNIEMAKSTRVPIGWLLLKGQQCKVFSQILYETRIRDFVVPVLEHDDGIVQKFKGATVLTAMRGAYFEPVSGLDFKSLYPSIMIAFNMCHSSYVMDTKYLGIKGVEYETVAWHEEAHKDDNTKEWIEAADYSFIFVQNIKGILPDILDRLWKDRNETKKEMKGEYKKCANEHNKTFQEDCPGCKYRFKAQVLNGKQLAIKVTMNSIYGFTGAGKGMLPCKPIAASVTAKGREMIAHTSQMAQELYDCTTTYGDSVPEYQKVKVKIKGNETDIKIGELYDQYSEIVPSIDYTNYNRIKKQLLLCEQPIDAWTANGWSKLRRVIRHETKKRMYKVTTDKGVVFVTEDHSLIDEKGNQIKPVELVIGEKIMWKNTHL